MTSFKFPPPPPPPPKASSNDAQHTYNSQRGNFQSGRGDRGRGRGGSDRGRGFHPRGGTRSAFGQGDRSGHAHSRGGPRGGSQFSSRGKWQSQNAPHVSPQEQNHETAPQATPLPNGTANGYPPVDGQTPQPDAATLAQAMAFMSTPVRMQSMAAFASHVATVNAAPQQPQAVLPQQLPHQYHLSPPSKNSRKRKRDDRPIPPESQKKQLPAHNAQQHNQKPPRAKAAAPPAVPSFGFSLPLSSSQPSTSKNGGGTNDQRKRKLNLGLTQLHDGSESGSDGDVDEEAAFVSITKVDGIVFEHQGESISLRTPAEITAWIKDRRKKYPTKQRIAEKAEEEVAKRSSELEFLRKIKRKSKAQRTVPGLSSASEPQSETTTHKSSATRRPDPTAMGQQSMMRNVVTIAPDDKRTRGASAKPSAIDLGLGYESESEPNEDDSSELSDSSVLSSSAESSDLSDSGEDEDADDSDMAPETQSAKVAVAPIVAPLPPPVKLVSEQKNEQRKICSQWQQTGRCKYGKNCRYPHPTKPEPKRVGLYERMVEQELEKVDNLALEAIKYLGRNGFLG